MDTTEMENQDNTAAGRESELKSVNSEKVVPELTLVLIGDTNSIEIGSKNILIDHDEQANEEQFSARLSDLCGRCISVINLLGAPNMNKFPVNEGIHAFLLLLPNGSHNNHYGSGVQWLEKAFGKESLAYLMTVVTYESDDSCECALSDLKANSSFNEKRYHTCRRTMMDAKEIITLVDKINVMVSENDPHCYSPLMCDENKEQGDPRPDCTVFEEERRDSSVSQQQTVETLGENADKSSAAKKTGTEGNIKKSMMKSEDINRKKQYTKDTGTLLGRLHLQGKDKQPFTPADFLKIGPPVKQDSKISEKDLAHTFLQRLIMLDYRARHIPVRQDSPEMSLSNPVDRAEPDVSDLDAYFSTGVDTDPSKQTRLHPMDVQMAVFHCSDSFFKQNMITKLSQCQYALPLIVPDPVTKDINCPLWTFRQIKKTWKITETNANTGTIKSMPICKAQTPMVSFFRLGSLSLSKSQLMNALINDRHNTFFHRNCAGSSKTRHFMDGVAEIAWYCPDGKPNDAFTDCIAFCNLHGDALLSEKQRDTLIEKSSINVIILSKMEKCDESAKVVSALLKSQKPLISLIVEERSDVVEIKKGKYKIGVKDKSQSDVSEELKKIIKNILSGPHDSFQLESMSEVTGLTVDEDGKLCQKGKSAAMKMVNLLQGMDISEIKYKYLPCQGQLWHEWCRTKKEMYHLKGQVEMEKCKKEKKLVETREKQCSASCGDLVKLFTVSLSSLKSPEKEYFLKWTQILIDALCTDDLSLILQNYDKKWSEVLVLKNKHDKSDQLKTKETELNEISKKLQSATFGLEHIFREMAQIYEAHASLKKQPKKTQTDWSKYPELAADLMISGHPMELMDGDAGHVPLTWINSLLNKVIEKLDNKRIFVLSVLGVQSSGKSTMLNAMFGLQFEVSTGRCTKGAFMQLVKVSEEIREDFRFDYVLVVDTEGLRAIELEDNATIHHDNELATFVVGLGNMTLINIFGENSAEMQDVLQIVVQAFMRMKEVKLSPRCVFVHQNVTDVAAAGKKMDGKRRLQEKLDQMAKLAAKEEGCHAECFGDVIAFDVQKDVKYFAQLWEGSPPMAPPNPGYSESVQDLKNFILSKASESAGITFLDFKSKIEDLWNALMNENFVFNFKNTLEIAVYRELEVEYGNWTWALRSNMLTVENQLYTRIENGTLDNDELSDLYEEMGKTYTEIHKDLITYIDDNSNKEMLVQWRGQFESKIKEFHEEQLRGEKRKLEEVIQQKKACKKLDDKKTEFENKLLQQSKELSQQLKDKANDEMELEKQFNSVWSNWVTELIADTKPIEDFNSEQDQKIILSECGFEWKLIDESKRSGKYKNISEIGNYIDYITLKTNPDLCNESQGSDDIKRDNKNTSKQGPFSCGNNFFKQHLQSGSKLDQNVECESQNSFPYEEQQLIINFINDVDKQSLEIIKNKPVAATGYSPTYFQELAHHVKRQVAKFGSERNYTIKKEFVVDLLLYVFDRTASVLSESHKKFKVNNDALTYLESKKSQYYNVFRGFCKGSSSTVVLGELICGKLNSSIVEAVCNKTAHSLACEMRCTVPAFRGNRLNLEKYVLKSLAEEENFKNFITYIQNPKTQVETFIKQEVKNYIYAENKEKAANVLMKNVDDIKTFVSQALFEATKKVKTQKGDIKIWLMEFSKLLKDKLTFGTISAQNFSDINKFDFLKDEIKKGLEPIMGEMSSLPLDKMWDFRLQPDQILITQLCNCCWETCPFCSAVCINTLKDHSPGKHNSPFHRPCGISGGMFKNTDKFAVDICTSLVASNKSFFPHDHSDETVTFKEYQRGGEKYAAWQITPDESNLTYWKWFVCRFKQQLEDYYQLKFHKNGTIPEEWKNHSRDDAIKSLDNMYNSEDP